MPSFLPPSKDLRGSIFDAVQYSRTAAGIRERTRKARNWYKDAIRNLSREYNIDRQNNVLVDRTISPSATKFIGKMYMYFYDPKHKATLPYYDRFPLVFIIEFYDDGFLGLNLHYLPYNMRFRLFDQLLAFVNNNSFDETTRLRMSYTLLKSMKKFRLAKPAIKRYLTSHVESKMKLVPAEDWEIALFLPVEMFTKASKEQVWNDTRKKARKWLW